MSGTNEPDFDPLNPTGDEVADMMRGYGDGIKGRPVSGESLAYAHGRRSGVHDRNGTADPEQRELARRFIREQSR